MRKSFQMYLILIYFRKKKVYSFLLIPVNHLFLEKNKINILCNHMLISIVPTCDYLQNSDTCAFRKGCYTMVILDYEEMNQESKCFLWLISHTLKFGDHRQGRYCRTLTVQQVSEKNDRWDKNPAWSDTYNQLQGSLRSEKPVFLYKKKAIYFFFIYYFL